MNADIYAEWLRRQGQTVIRTQSSYWHSSGMGAYQSFPYHWLIEPSRKELRELTFRRPILALRYSMSGESGLGSDSYHATYTGSDYDFETLSGWARKNVRRGLRLCSVHQISLERYIEEGWDLRIDTLARQERSVKESRDDWRRKYSAIEGLAGFEIWAAEVQDRLAATLVTFQMDGWGYMIYQQCHRDYLREHANNALSFVVTQNFVRKPGIKGIFYGMQSLDAPPSVDDFKFRMGYEARPVRQRIVFSPYLSLFVNGISHRLLEAGHRFFPDRRWLAKAEGMFRLSLMKPDQRQRRPMDSELQARSESVSVADQP